jgi:lysophospholipase L1-like esterase
MGVAASEIAFMSLSRVRRTHRLDVGLNLALILVSLLVALLAAEIGLRLRKGVTNLWDTRNLVADPARVPGLYQPMVVDPLLGYAPRPGYRGSDKGKTVSFDKNGLRVHGSSDRPSKLTDPPVLAVGDSYVMGVEVADDDTWPARLEERLDHRVLNAGVRGYGIDQSVLRAEQLVPMHHPDVVLVGFIADDIRRAEERVLWGIDKPYFDIADGELVLRNVPIRTAQMWEPPPLDAARRVLGHSYVADFVMRRLGLAAWWHRDPRLRHERAHSHGMRVACLLMGRLRQLHDSYAARVIVIAQYSKTAWLESGSRRKEREITGQVIACAQQNGLQTLDTHDALAQAVRVDGVEAYYATTHMNARGNRFIADLIAPLLPLH